MHLISISFLKLENIFNLIILDQRGKQINKEIKTLSLVMQAKFPDKVLSNNIYRVSQKEFELRGKYAFEFIQN